MTTPSLEEFRVRLQTEPVMSTILRTPATNALAAIAQLQADIVSSAAAVRTANLGPFELSGSCDYDCFIGICMKTYSWSWPLDFSEIRPDLQQAVAELSNAAGAFGGAFASSREWLKGTLQQFSAQFTQQAQIIITTNQQIMQAGGTPNMLLIMKVMVAFETITDGLEAGQAQMAQATQAAAQFVQTLSGIESGLSPLLASLQGSINAGVNHAQTNFINSMSCGQGDASVQIAAAIATFNVSIATIQNSFNTLSNDIGAFQNSNGQFVSSLVSLLDQYKNVASQVNIAGQYPAGAIQDLHLDIAANEWAQLAKYAVANIQ